jgi:glycosyltransferase involved in cell wall biosynthesis
MPSTWWEAFGLVISEAWMFRRPVIVSNVGAMAERVRDGVDGLHFAISNHIALSEIIRLAATTVGIWDRLSSGIQSPPSRGEMVDRFVEIYRGAASMPSGRTRAREGNREVIEVVFGT